MIEVHGYDAYGGINVTLDGVQMNIPDDFGNRHRVLISEWEEEGNTIPAYVPPAPPALTKLYKSNFIRRLTTAEATAFEAILMGEEAWVRMLYNSVEFFDVSDALVGYLNFTLAAEVGQTRADELLEPEA